MVRDGGAAFPVPAIVDQAGMSLRQWYAGQALAGLLANPSDLPLAGEPNPQQWLADASFTYADAMIAHEVAEREGA